MERLEKYHDMSAEIDDILIDCKSGIITRSQLELVCEDYIKRLKSEEQIYKNSSTFQGLLNYVGNRLIKPIINTEHYKDYDFIIGMDSENARWMPRILGGDPEEKISLLMDYTDHPRSVADPWYTGNFEATYNDVIEGCGLFEGQESNIVENKSALIKPDILSEDNFI